RRVDARVFELPITFQQGCALRLDALLEMTGIIERIDADAAKLGALLAAADGVDDGGAVAAFLPDPKTAARLAKRRDGRALHVGFEPLRALMQHCREGIVERR